MNAISGNLVSNHLPQFLIVHNLRLNYFNHNFIFSFDLKLGRLAKSHSVTGQHLSLLMNQTMKTVVKYLISPMNFKSSIQINAMFWKLNAILTHFEHESTNIRTQAKTKQLDWDKYTWTILFLNSNCKTYNNSKIGHYLEVTCSGVTTELN